MTPAFVEPAEATTAHTPGRWLSTAVRKPSAVKTRQRPSARRARAARAAPARWPRTSAWCRRPPPTAPPPPPTSGGVAGHGQRREVPRRAPADEAAAGRLRKPGQLDEEAQHLVLGVDRARGLQPALPRERRRAHDGVEECARRRRRGRDEGQEPRAVEADGGRSDHRVEAPERLGDAQATLRDRHAELRGQRFGSGGGAERCTTGPTVGHEALAQRHHEAGVVVEAVHR